jgi:hypothetical protein
MADTPWGVVVVKGRIHPGAVAKQCLQSAKGSNRAYAGRIKFHTIAGRKNDGSRQAINPAHGLQGFLDSVWGHCELLTNADRSTVMVKTRAEDVHGLEERY